MPNENETRSKTPPSLTEKEKTPDQSMDIPATVGKSKEIGGRDGLDPTRYGDWEKTVAAWISEEQSEYRPINSLNV